MRKPERIENALKAFEAHIGNIDHITHDLNNVDFMDDLTDEEKSQKEAEWTRDLRFEHGRLTHTVDQFLKLMRNNERYFGGPE